MARRCRAAELIGGSEDDYAGYVAAVVAKAEAGGIHGAELAAMCRRLRQLGEQDAGLLPGDVLEPLASLPRLPA